jgi:hypothetical protein
MLLLIGLRQPDGSAGISSSFLKELEEQSLGSLVKPIYLVSIKVLPILFHSTPTGPSQGRRALIAICKSRF